MLRRAGGAPGQEEAGSKDQAGLGGGGAGDEPETRAPRCASRRAQVLEGGPHGGNTVGLRQEGRSELRGERKTAGWRVSTGRDSQGR